MTETSSIPRARYGWLGPVAVALAAWLAVLAGLDPAGSYPDWPQGPGLTVDERFNVQEGVRLTAGTLDWFGGSVSLTELYNDDNPPHVRENIGQHNPDHPPLGRLGIGIFHEAAVRIAPPADREQRLAVAAARTAPATAFALTVLLVGLVGWRWYGTTAGVAAAASLVLMPRVFGHAHLASLESFIGLSYAAAVLSLASRWSGERPPRARDALWPGVVFGLALATKIQAVLLPVPIGLWALWRWRLRAVVPLVVWGGVGMAVLLVCWPWLWLDPLDHLREYLGRTTERTALPVWYFGRAYADVDVPWHYPLVLFVATIPLGIHALAAAGLGARHRGRTAWREPASVLVLSAAAFPLAVFAVPGVAVYDGGRLFLVSYPLWALLAGRGATVVFRRIETTARAGLRRAATAGVVALFAAQALWLVSLAPCWLSYYNALMGGLSGAAAIGLEPTYWGDCVTPRLLRETARRVPVGATIDFTPVLEPGQLAFLESQSPLLRRQGIRLRPFEDRLLETGEVRYLLMYRRKSSISPLFRDGPPPDSRLLAEVRRQGVQLAALYAIER
ncbi:MAG: glycosyltransferase family 39 protein [Planctomycetes bacterium]|nr:glycosyltransferase family 39 protein [Planctomycetota bacterium]